MIHTELKDIPTSELKKIVEKLDEWLTDKADAVQDHPSSDLTKIWDEKARDWLYFSEELTKRDLAETMRQIKSIKQGAKKWD